MRRSGSRWMMAIGLAAAVAAQGQTIRYVSKTGSQTSPYNTWARAATNIHVAVAGAATGTVILVTNGVYTLTNTITLATNIAIQSVNGPDATSLEGNNTFRLFSLSGGAALRGVTIRRGLAAGAIPWGGGVYANGAVISNCAIVSCVSTDRGGGVYFYTNAGTIVASRIESCDSPYGGGVYCRGGGTISNCTFIGNRALGSAGTGGGGAYLYQGGSVARSTFRGNTAGNDGGGVLMESGGSVESSHFYDNVAGDWGGAATVYFAGGVLRNCVISGNRADEGGGVYFHQSGLLESSTVVNNDANLNGSGVKFSGGGTSVNSIVYFNAGDNYALDSTNQMFRFTCTTPALTGPEDQGGNITADPSFLYQPDRIYHLNPDSPCINAGTNVPWMSAGTDIYGSPRQIGTRPDIGAYEFGPLVAHFAGSPLVGAPPLAVSFQSYVTGSNLVGLIYKWDAQNNGVAESTGAAASAFAFTYTNGGQYSVRLDVTNAIGQLSTLVRTNYVFASVPHYVSTNGTHVSPFITWATAATNLEAALAVTESGGQIYVTNGTYQLRGEMVVTQAVYIQSMNGPGSTVFRGSGTTRVFRIKPGVALGGFTIRDGVATGALSAAYGGGVYCDLGGSVSNCTVTANRAGEQGGGIYLNYGGEVSGCVIHSNRASRGGGVMGFAGGVMYNLQISTNVANDRGGGVYLYGNSVLRSSIIERNAAVSNGGGVAFFSSGGAVQNCTIVSNTANDGGGLFCEDGGNVQNTISYFNSATTGAANWQTNTLVYNYGAIFQNTCVTPTNALPAASNCFTNDPRFTTSGGSPYGLDSLSYCVNRGLYGGWMSGRTDLLGAPRIVGGAPDVGALERVILALAISSPSSGTRLPFRATYVQVTGSATGLVGQMMYTNRYPSGAVSGTLTLATNWSFTVPMPHYGDQVITITATDAVGNVAVDSLTITRNKNQVFIPAYAP